MTEQSVFTDTSAYYALIDKSDEYHVEADLTDISNNKVISRKEYPAKAAEAQILCL